MKALKVGQVLDLEIEKTQPRVRLKATVQKYEMGECEVTLNEMDAPPPELTAGVEIQARFCTAQGFHEGSSTVLKVRPAQPPEVLLDAFRRETHRQRRAYFRTSAYLPCQVTVLVSKKIKAGESDRRAISLDISGGGIRIETSLGVIPEDLLTVVVRVPQKLQPALPAILLSEGKVLRVVDVVRQGRDLHQIAVAFQIKREVDRDPWVHLAMDLERGLDKERVPGEEDDG